MQDRWISYIFRYKDNKKCENAGFAKMIRTSKGSTDEARIEIGLKLYKPVLCRCRIYFILDESKLVLMDELLIKPEERDVIGYKKSIGWKDFLKAGCTPRDYDGIFLAVDDGDMLMSIWNDKNIIIDNLQTNFHTTTVVEKASNAEQQPIVENIPVTELPPVPEKTPDIATIPIPDYLMNVQNNLNYDRPIGVEEETITEASHEDVANDISIDDTRENNNPIENIFKTHMKLPNLVDSPFTECVKMLPQDIGKLPMGNWKLGQNSFLTHSYYRYKYIMLGKVMVNDRQTYVIGVPGVYTSKERYMANMFGFSLFVPVKTADTKTGKFGYWLWEIVKE